MENQKQIDDIIAMLDKFVSNGGGHMNISMDESEDQNNVSVTTYKSNDCTGKNMACAVPTLQNNLDASPNENQ